MRCIIRQQTGGASSFIFPSRSQGEQPSWVTANNDPSPELLMSDAIYRTRVMINEVAVRKSIWPLFDSPLVPRHPHHLKRRCPGVKLRDKLISELILFLSLLAAKTNEILLVNRETLGWPPELPIKTWQRGYKMLISPLAHGHKKID